MNTSEISGGVLKAWHHVHEFNKIETHIDSEMFFFISETALMLFIDVKDAKPEMSTLKVVRIKSGTQMIIQGGKGHFVIVAESFDPVCAIVVSPKMDAPRIQ